MANKREIHVITEPVNGFDERVFTTGRGVFIFSDNSRYDGEWIELDGRKLKHGYGIFTLGKEKYEGYWKFDIMQDNSINDVSLDEPSTCFDAHVSEYYKIGDGSTYDKHYFILNIRIDNSVYAVDRSYIDFITLDYKLRENFPHIHFSSLPLDALQSFQRQCMKDHMEKNSQNNRINILLTQINGKENMIEKAFDDVINPSKFSLKVRERYNESIGSKVALLDNYIVDLLKYPDILLSDDLILFFNNEAPSMALDPLSLEPLSEFDLLLLSEPMNTSLVSRQKEHQFRLRRGQFLLWAFSTLNFDIGFSIEMNGEVKVPYGRHKSHESAICGALEATFDCSCKLIWDNSYAKLRTKQLTWVARIVKMEDYHAAKAQASEVRKEKKRFEDKRHNIKMAAIRHTHIRDDKTKLMNLSSEIQKIEERLRQSELENAEMKRVKQYSDRKIEHLESENLELVEKVESIYRLVTSSEVYISTLEGEKHDLQAQVADWELRCEALDDKVNILLINLTKCQNESNSYVDSFLSRKLVERNFDID